jgi:hypothetical protein
MEILHQQLIDFNKTYREHDIVPFEIVSTLTQVYTNIDQCENPTLIHSVLEHCTKIVNRMGSIPHLKPELVYPLTSIKRRMAARYDFKYDVHSFHELSTPLAPSRVRRRQMPVEWFIPRNIIDFYDTELVDETIVSFVMCDCQICFDHVLCAQYCRCTLMMCRLCRRRVYNCPQCRQSLHHTTEI